MKTFAHINAAGDVVGIGLIYNLAGNLLEPVAAKVAKLGEDAGIKAYGESVCWDASCTTVVVDTMQMPGDDPNGYDKTFQGAYKYAGGLKVDIDLQKAKLIAHEIRRAKRQAELAPLDMLTTIPAMAAEAEAKRQKIRDDYVVIQASADAALDAIELKAVVTAIRARS